MALSNDALARIRRAYYKIRGAPLIEPDKIDLKAVADAMEARWDADKATWVADMEAAFPGGLDGAEKNKLAAAFFQEKFVELRNG